MDLHNHSQLLKNSQPMRGEVSGEVGMASQVLPSFEFRSLPLVRFCSGEIIFFLLGCLMQ